MCHREREREREIEKKRERERERTRYIERYGGIKNRNRERERDRAIKREMPPFSTRPSGGLWPLRVEGAYN